MSKSVFPFTTLYELFDPILSTRTSFYTDGFKSGPGNYVGLAIYSPPPLNYQFKARISFLASIFTAEALSIALAIEYIHSNNIQQAIIFTDPISTLQALSHPTNILSSPHASRIKVLLSELEARGHSVVLVWIPGHAGIHGNEKADELAKKATSSGIECMQFETFIKVCTENNLIRIFVMIRVESLMHAYTIRKEYYSIFEAMCILRTITGRWI